MPVLGIDIGGTFTDLVLLDPETGALHTHKLLTTPHDPIEAVLQGTRELLHKAGQDHAERVVHGTTLITNAIVERKGARTALLTTRGFRDVLEIRREGRYDLYDLDLEFPEPLVPRHRRFEAPERMDEGGTILEPLDEAALEEILGSTAGEKTESWAVCFLHAYANPVHEQQAAEMLAKKFPNTPVSISSEVAPEIREYERTSTTVANAYVRPVAEGYLNRLADGLQTELHGAKPALHIMSSDGGMTAPETAARFPIRIVESGPAGGVVAAARVGKGLGTSPLLSLDMGGTTAKIAFLDAQGPRTRNTFEVDRRRFYKSGSGLPLLLPTLDLVEIGAGGGSIAGKGPLGTLTVGPESAGADPGPACYGRGGERPTVTDADLVLGLLNPEYFLGGAMSLELQAARHALEKHVAEPLRGNLFEAAIGVHEMVGGNMAEAARVHAAERGLDLAAHTLVAFGGAGPVHAWSFARQVRIERVLFPGHGGVESALGFLAAGPAFEVARSVNQSLADLNEEEATTIVAGLIEEARAPVSSLGKGEIMVSVSVDMRYRGQGFEVRVPLPGPETRRQTLAAAFEEFYRNAYGRTVDGVPVEVVTWRVRCEKESPPIPVFDRAGDPVADLPPPNPVDTRKAWMPDAEDPARIPVYRRHHLEPGMFLEGPALIEEPQCTLVIGRGTARVLPGGTILAEVLP